MMRWRSTARHRSAQEAGRNGVFSGYRPRVAHVLRDYGMDDRAEAPEDSCGHHEGVAQP